ncbi:DNA-processing protein DprA [Aliiruegeria lutimaris]|uniref:DNA-processing protein DprA n=1 Tax=Aliiruegeria lutimaris TaxID=571298 RepID=UPI000B89142A
MAWLRLLRSHRVGTATFYRLMNEHAGDAEAALAALPQVAAAAGMSRYTPFSREQAEQELEAGYRAGARPLFIGAQDFPAALMDLTDAPPMLWAIGDSRLAERPTLAMVGARNASSLGRRAAASLARGLGDAGFVIVSGLARGIDGVVHKSALETGTIAVVAGGVDVIYPRENAELTAQIAERGMILSEMPPGMRPQARHFPRRNRIVSGLASAVIVVEAAARSGSLITARDALDQGRDVLAMPGHPLDARAAGCNMLIRDGATLIRGVEDVLEATGPLGSPLPRQSSHRSARSPIRKPAGKVSPPRTEPAQPTIGSSPGSIRTRILSLLGPAPIAEDQLLRDLSLPNQVVAGELLELEMEGQVERQPGGLLALSA